LSTDLGVEDKELEEIRRRKLLELQRRLLEEEERRRREELEEAMRDALLRSILTHRARERLLNLKLVKPEVARLAEDTIIQLVQAGRLRVPVDEDTVTSILSELDARSRREFRIVFKRK
jgi:programmed cell death protein 5